MRVRQGSVVCYDFSGGRPFERLLAAQRNKLNICSFSPCTERAGGYTPEDYYKIIPDTLWCDGVKISFSFSLSAMSAEPVRSVYFDLAFAVAD